jgi:ribosomal protein L7Ae-like RNA K-turn-binding protein
LLPSGEPAAKDEQVSIIKNENYETDEQDEEEETEDENSSNDEETDNEEEEEETDEEEGTDEETTTTDDNNSNKTNSPAVVVKSTTTNETEPISNSNLDNNNLTISASNPMSPISQGSPISIGGYTPTTYSTLSMLANDRTLLSLEKLEEQVKQKIHNKKFREYCNQITNKEIDEVCSFLLHEIVRFQDRLYHKNPAKAKTKRRYVMGIREVTKHLKLHKLKCVILAPNCEKIQSKGGLDDAINQIIQKAMEQNVPFVFALGRKGLGKAVNKLVPISVVGIFDYSGAEEYFRRLVDLANNAKLAYQEIVEEYEKEECENLIAMQTNVVNNLDTKILNNNNNVPLLPTPTPYVLNNPTINTTTNNSVLLNNVQYLHYPPLPLQPPPPPLLPLPSLAPHHHGHVIQLTSHNPIIPSHMGHSRNSSTGSNISIEPFAYHMNYHTHSRSASGNFNFGQTSQQAGGHVVIPTTATHHHHHGHSRSASGGNSSIMNIDFGGIGGVSAGAVNKHWTHSRTPSNCSNISFISRLSEPISEVGSCGTLLINNSSTNLNSYNSISNSNLAPFYISNSNTNLNQINNNTALAASLAAVQYYTEQVRQEMREQQQHQESILIVETDQFQQQQQQQQQQQLQQPYINDYENQSIVKEETTNAVSSSLVNLHLGCIDEADIESADLAKTSKTDNQ